MLFKNSKAFSSFSVDDLDKAKTFYGETLGLKVKETPEGLELHLPQERYRYSSIPPMIITRQIIRF
jgi:hypothetical protein